VQIEEDDLLGKLLTLISRSFYKTGKIVHNKKATLKPLTREFASVRHSQASEDVKSRAEMRKSMNIPKDPVILLSFVNTKLRDEYPSLDDLCLSLNIDRTQLEATLSTIAYTYNPETNHFISV
jgi:hypothetical protein